MLLCNHQYENILYIFKKKYMYERRALLYRLAEVPIVEEKNVTPRIPMESLNKCSAKSAR